MATESHFTFSRPRNQLVRLPTTWRCRFRMPSYAELVELPRSLDMENYVYVVLTASSTEVSDPPMHDALKSLAWLEGEWRAEDGQGKYPTIKNFCYCEVLKFVSIGQPMLNYEAQSWHPEKKSPMHREVGFLKIIPGTEKVALVLAHNFGLTTVEEGVVRDNEIQLESTSISRISKGTKEPAVTKVRRELRLVDDRLEQIVYMATSTTPEITEHLRARYVKQPSQ